MGTMTGPGQGPEPTAAAQTPMQYYEYPSTIGKGTTENWIAFEATGFKSQRPTFEVALYIPGDALSTSYKSEYESVSLGGLGAMTDKAVSAMQNTGGPPGRGFSVDNLTTMLSAQASATGSEAGKVGLLKAGERANLLVEGSKTVMS